MKKRIALLAAIIMITAALAGCNENGGREEQSQSVTSASTEGSVTEAAETEQSEALTEQEESSEPQDREPVADLNELKYKELEQLFSALKDSDENFSEDTAPSSFKVVSANEVAVGKEYAAELFRQSTGMMCTDEEQAGDFSAAIEAAPKLRSAMMLSKMPVTNNDTVFTITYDGELKPEILNITSGYTAKEMTVCGFVCQVKDGSYEVIIDPASMAGMAVPLTAPTEYSINGKKVLMDTVAFAADGIEDFSYSDYVCAQMTVKGLTVSYDRDGNNYSQAEEIVSFEVIEENALQILDFAETVKKFEESGDGSAEVYRTLLDNTDLMLDDNIVGVQLIDLDFDGAPELLVSREYTDNGLDYIHGADVDIYILKDGKANYVDTLHNSDLGRENVIGVKTTDRLEKAWFYGCRGVMDGGVYTENTDSADYLFTLENGRLNFTEIFRRKFTRFKEGSDVAMFDYYFLGTKIVPEEVGGKYRWKGFEAFADIWGIGEICILARDEYCSDIKTVYNLYSDWLFDAEKNQKLPVSESLLRYRLARLVDNYYNGGNEALAEGYK